MSSDSCDTSWRGVLAGVSGGGGMKFQASETWLKKMAEAEDGCYIGVGSSICDPRQLERLMADLKASKRAEEAKRASE